MHSFWIYSYLFFASSAVFAELESEISNFLENQLLEDETVRLTDKSTIPIAVRSGISGFDCRNKPRISRFPDPSDCTKFIYCVVGTAYPGRCPNGMHFNPTTRHCDLVGNVVSCLPPAIGIPSQKPTFQSLPLQISPTTDPYLNFPQLQSVLRTTPTPLQTSPSPLAPGTTDIPSSTGSSSPQITSNPLALSQKPSVGPSSFTTTPVPIPVTTLRPKVLQDTFNFTLDCMSKHPCGLYPNTKGDCTSFYLCGENGTLISKHCHGGQLFDFKTLECQEPSKARCWSEPDSGAFVGSSKVSNLCQFHNRSHSVTQPNGKNEDIYLSSPVVTNWGAWQGWADCPKGYYITGVNVWKRLLQQGSAVDLAGVVSLAFQCENIAGPISSSSIIESLAPGVPNDGWPSFYSCSGNGAGGAAIGFRLNSQKDQGPLPNDNVATDNVEIICSCGPTSIHKPYENIPGPQSGHRGDWTQEQICEPRQALCGMQTQMADYRERVLGSYDNTGLNNLKMKCCSVPDPAEECEPREEVRLVRKCENSQGIYPRRCDFEPEVGITYDQNGVSNWVRAVNFYESIGFSLEESRVKLRKKFPKELVETNITNSIGYEYDWKDSESRNFLWEPENSKNRTKRAIYIDVGTQVELFQVVGTCSYFTVKTNRYIRYVTEIGSRNVTHEYFET